jgi:hypothetical protein
VSAVFVGDAGRSLYQLQDCAACGVELVTAVCRVFFNPRKRNHIRLGVATMHHSALPLDFNKHIAGWDSIVAFAAFPTSSMAQHGVCFDLLRMSNNGAVYHPDMDTE